MALSYSWRLVYVSTVNLVNSVCTFYLTVYMIIYAGQMLLQSNLAYLGRHPSMSVLFLIGVVSCEEVIRGTSRVTEVTPSLTLPL